MSNTRSEKKKFTIGFKVEGRFYIDVEANSIEEAIELGGSKVESADFGELCDIEWERGCVLDEDGCHQDEPDIPVSQKRSLIVRGGKNGKYL